MPQNRSSASSGNPPARRAALDLLQAVVVERAARERADRLHALEFAPKFSSTALLWPGENALSRVFGWMLDESATHGQGTRFRVLFVDMLLEGAHWPSGAPDWTGARISCEVPTRDASRRIDILMLSRSEGHRLAIENKPWANWQENQLRRYLDDQEGFGSDVVVLVLVGGVTDTSAARAEVQSHWGEGEAPGNIHAVGYDCVVKWIDRCAEVARPPQVRSFLFDLRDYCRRNACPGGLSMSEIDELATLILQRDAASVRAAFDIEAAMPTLRSEFLRAVAGELGRLNETPTGSRDWEIKLGVSDTRYKHADDLSIRGSDTKITIVVELFPKSGEPWIGLSRPSPVDAAPLIDQGWAQSEGWAAYCYLTPAGQLAAVNDAFLAKDTKRLASTLIEFSQDLVDRLRPA